MIINKRGYFEDSNPGHPIDENLGKYLCQYFGSKYAGHTVLDLGCGDGYYTKLLRENPYSVGNKIQCDGYDGNPNTPQLTNGICGILDLTVSFKLVKKYHTVLCLEVGEHIPKTYFLNFIENIHNNNTEEVILSWAIPGQGGHGAHHHFAGAAGWRRLPNLRGLAG